MLAFKYRFHGHGSLRYVYTNGQTVRSRLMSLKYSRHPKRKNPRVAVVISKKVIKGAVGRNRVRRRLYEVIRLELPRIEHNADIVLLVFSGEVLTMPASDMVEVVRQLLGEAGVYKK
jgi:ribonuclease P protein component